MLLEQSGMISDSTQSTLKIRISGNDYFQVGLVLNDASESHTYMCNSQQGSEVKR